jgi:hypothetical protein
MKSLDPCERAGAAQLRFGIILNSSQPTSWEADCVSRLVDSGMCRLQVVVVTRKRPEPLKKLLDVFRSPLWALYAASNAFPQTSKLLKPRPFSETEAIQCSQEDGAIVLEDDQLKSLNDHRLDFLLAFVSAQLDPRLLDVPRQGVWLFSYGDEESNDSQPPALREVALGAHVISIRLSRLNGGRQSQAMALRSGVFAVEPYSYAKTLDRARQACADFPLLACRDIIRGRQGELRSMSAAGPCSSQARTPGNRLMLGLLLGSFRCNVSRLLRGAFTRLVWNSGFVDLADFDPTKSQTAAKVRWLPVERNSIAADPFLIRWKNRLTLLTENVNRTDNRGFIEAWSVQNGEAIRLGKIIEEPVHLSYPYVVQWQGNMFCVPEQARARAVVLYRAIDFPTRWERAGEMLSGVEAIDPTLFRFGSFWWLAYTDASIDRHGRLMLWYSSEPLGPWKPHALNPVKIDPRSSRGAGPPFFHGDHLVRPAQDCCGEYGARVVFNRITKLTPEEFHEDVIGELTPDPNGQYPAGLHTICRDGDIGMIDGKTYVIDATAWFSKLRRKLGIRPDAAIISEAKRAAPYLADQS